MSRWLEETGGRLGDAYEEHFARLAADGQDVHGEASFVARIAPAPSRVLDAGCGTGRVARELARRGHDVVGVDNDASMLAVARRAAPDLRWVDSDLSAMALDEVFDVVVMAGNVIVFVAPGTEADVVQRCAEHVRPGGLLVCGWSTDRLSRAQYDVLASGAGLQAVDRFATWDGQPWREDGTFCVAVDRRG